MQRFGGGESECGINANEDSRSRKNARRLGKGVIVEKNKGGIKVVSGKCHIQCNFGKKSQKSYDVKCRSLNNNRDLCQVWVQWIPSLI